MLISAANIKDCTGSSRFWPGSPPAPSKEALIEQTCVRLTCGSAFNKAAPKGALKFERMVYNPPEGLAIVPVFFAPAGNSHAVRREYNDRVLKGQYKRLATECADAMSLAGISRWGLKTMREDGKHPVSTSGRREKGSLDHIVWVKYAGLWAAEEEKCIDPAITGDSSPRFPENHTGNFIWLIDWVHGLKNRFNTAQCINNPDAAAGRGWWGLDIVPVRDDRYDGFVCPPQPSHLQDAKHMFAL